MSAFSGTPFAAGSLIGFRHWRALVDGTLCPVNFGSMSAWSSGVNVAECNKFGVHGAPRPQCTCGFYGYFSPDNSDYRLAGNVAGVVEAFGRCVVGSLGFRAEKARIVALCREPEPSYCEPYCSACQSTANQVRSWMPAVEIRYSDLPWYDSEAEMLAAHPLTTEAVTA